MALVAGFVSLVAVSAVIRGFVLTVLWGWFVTETFGIQQINIAEAIGLSLIVGMFTQDSDDVRGEGRGSSDIGVALLGVFFTVLASSIFALLLGWFIHQFT